MTFSVLACSSEKVINHPHWRKKTNRNELNVRWERLFRGRLAPTRFPMQLVRRCLIQMYKLLVLAFTLASCEFTSHFGAQAQPRMKKRRSHYFTVVIYMCVILKQTNRIYCEINSRWASYLLRYFKCFILFLVLYKEVHLYTLSRWSSMKNRIEKKKYCLPFSSGIFLSWFWSLSATMFSQKWLLRKKQGVILISGLYHVQPS